MRNQTRHALAAGEVVLGSLAVLADPAAVEVMGHAGLDFAIIDMEHTERDMSGVLAIIRGADSTGLTPFVRVPSLDDKEILRALEAGAHGIMAPSIRSGEQARQLDEACRYPGGGIRGSCRFSRAAGFGVNAARWGEFTVEANREVMSIALVEDEKGAAEIEEIVAAVDVTLVGRGDLCTALGVPGQVDHPLVMEVVARYEAAARRHDRPLATMCYSTQDARRWVEKGYRFLIHTADVNILYQAYAAWRAGMGGAGDG